MYPSENWHQRVDRMPDRQIHAIYETAKKPGGRLDENMRKVLKSLSLKPGYPNYIDGLQAWEIYELFQRIERDIPVIGAPIKPTEMYHQVSLFELGDFDHG